MARVPQRASPLDRSVHPPRTASMSVDPSNAGASTTLDDYGLKILLAYFEFYNNFVGF